ncbi:glycosyltransferase family 2 protein [bacterium]|nr:glycosyltransferase family 2 protein [bacterium]
MDISIVVPAYNEKESLPELCAWIDEVMKKNNYTYEVIIVDDGSTDGSWDTIESINNKNPSIKGIKFKRNQGKSAALHTAFQVVEGNMVVTMDADLQDSPEEIPEFKQMIDEEGFDLVSGWKQKRFDPITKTIPTKLYNWTTRKMSGIYLNDFNCGLKAYKKEVVKNIEVYGEMHRYIPVIAKWRGFANIGEKVVQHQARKYGSSKFGLERFVNGFLDLMSITFVSKFGKKPMHFFGLIGTLMFILGFLMTLYLGAYKMYSLINHLEARLITDQPVFYISLVCMILGTQLFLAGFLAELLSRNNPNRNNYLIEKELL